MRFVTSFAGALLCASIAVYAQDTKTTTKTKTSADDGKAQQVTYTGCVQSGTETRTFVLDKVVPVTTTKTTEVAGTGGTVSTTSTSYILVPGEKVELQTHVGHKVEVTGMLIPAGEWKTETKTKIEREGAKDTNTKVTTKGDSDQPHFRVLSVKPLNEPCM
jgi:hypothetical protein